MTTKRVFLIVHYTGGGVYINHTQIHTRCLIDFSRRYIRITESCQLVILCLVRVMPDFMENNLHFCINII